jgi:hypothetical protein
MSSEDKHRKKKAKKKLPEHLEVQRENVICGAEMNFHVRRSSNTWRLPCLLLPRRRTHLHAAS